MQQLKKSFIPKDVKFQIHIWDVKFFNRFQKLLFNDFSKTINKSYSNDIYTRCATIKEIISARMRKLIFFVY